MPPVGEVTSQGKEPKKVIMRLKNKIVNLRVRA
jgi:hypothetical protein